MSGRSVARWALEVYDLCIDDAGQVLTADPAYQFGHDATVNFEDLVWIQASAYFCLGDFDTCLQKILILDPAFVAGVPLEDSLLAKLELLGTMIVG